MNDLQKIVFSRTLVAAPWKPATPVRDDPVKAASRLKRQAGKDMVVVGSGTLVSALLRGSFIDEFFRVRPIILGAGSTSS